MTGNLQADGVQSRQTLFVRYCLHFFPLLSAGDSGSLQKASAKCAVPFNALSTSIAQSPKLVNCFFAKILAVQPCYSTGFNPLQNTVGTQQAISADFLTAHPKRTAAGTGRSHCRLSAPDTLVLRRPARPVRIPAVIPATMPPDTVEAPCRGTIP